MARTKTKTAADLAQWPRCSEVQDSLVQWSSKKMKRYQGWAGNSSEKKSTRNYCWTALYQLQQEEKQVHWRKEEQSIHSWPQAVSALFWLFETFMVEYEFYDFIQFLHKLSLRLWEQFLWLYILFQTVWVF